MTSRCGKCDGTMKEGFLIDHTSHRSKSVTQWAEGEPSYWILGILRMGGRRRLPVEAYRCTKCGYLESYAVESSR